MGFKVLEALGAFAEPAEPRIPGMLLGNQSPFMPTITSIASTYLTMTELTYLSGESRISQVLLIH